MIIISIIQQSIRSDCFSFLSAFVTSFLSVTHIAKMDAMQDEFSYSLCY